MLFVLVGGNQDIVLISAHLFQLLVEVVESPLQCFLTSIRMCTNSNAEGRSDGYFADVLRSDWNLVEGSL